MIKKNIVILILGLAFSSIPAQFEFNEQNSLNRNGSDTDGLPSNAIVDIAITDSNIIYFATGGGLGYWDMNIDFPPYPDPVTFYTVNNPEMPRGSNPCVVSSENVIAVSGKLDTLANNNTHFMGTGIGYSTDGGEIWKYKPQPVHPRDSELVIDFEWGGQTLQQLAITTEIQNVSWDLAIQGNYIYSTSWAGGLRRFDFTNDESEWESIALPLDNERLQYCGYIDDDNYQLNPLDPNLGNSGNHNHKGFSVFAMGDSLLWVGTANGINKGTIRDECIDWVHYTTTVDGFSGNWVYGFESQQIDEETTRLWAVTWSTGGVETNSISWTDDFGENWYYSHYLENIGAKVIDISVDEITQRVYVATEIGLYVNVDIENDYWERYDYPSEFGESILTEFTYSSETLEDILFYGSGDGLAITNDDGINWDVIRFWKEPEDPSLGDENFYAYPNPFYVNDNLMMNGDGHIRFAFFTDGQQGVEDRMNYNFDIFDFSMNYVVNDLYFSVGQFNKGEIVWNGRNDWGETVANGVYFCRLTIGDETYWTKVLVVN
jgi:hypothetical protein